VELAINDQVNNGVVKFLGDVHQGGASVEAGSRVVRNRVPLGLEEAVSVLLTDSETVNINVPISGPVGER
jgi:hypothetical protein